MLAKIIVRGNSNSILRDGWVPAFQDADPSIEMVNLSLGGSRSPALLYQVLDNTDVFQAGDIVIIEPTVLDCGEVAGNGNDVAGQANALLSVLLGRQLVPLLLVLPRKPKHAAVPSPGMLAWAGIARSMGVAVFDGSHVIKLLAEMLTRDAEDLWRDQHGHHVPAAGRLIGCALSLFRTETQIVPAHTSDSGPHNKALPWRIVLGSELALQSGLPSRKSSTALIAIDCVVLSSGDVVNCRLEDGEKVLGIGINYGEMDPTQDVLIEVGGPLGMRRLNMSHSILPATAARKARVLFRTVNLPVGYGNISLSSCPENSRFSSTSDERLEISGVLVGSQIEPLIGWEESGRVALGESHEFIESYLQGLIEKKSNLLPS